MRRRVSRRAAPGWIAREHRPIFRVTPLAGPRIVAALDAAGVADDSTTATCWRWNLGPISARSARRGHRPVCIRGFSRPSRRLQGYSDDKLGKLTALLAVRWTCRRGASCCIRRTGAPVASSLMAVADGIVITGNVVTDRDAAAEGLWRGHDAHRARLGARGGRHGSPRSMSRRTIRPGMALYRRLGYRPQYDYHYRMPRRRMSENPILLVVACALVDADRRVLIAQRPAGKQLAGLWEFPGRQARGGREPGGGTDPRTRGRTWHFDQDGVPRAANLCVARLRKLSSSDATFRLPEVAGNAAGRASMLPSNGCVRRRCATIPCRRPMSR